MNESISTLDERCHRGEQIYERFLAHGKTVDVKINLSMQPQRRHQHFHVIEDTPRKSRSA